MRVRTQMGHDAHRAALPLVVGGVAIALAGCAQWPEALRSDTTRSSVAAAFVQPSPIAATAATAATAASGAGIATAALGDRASAIPAALLPALHAPMQVEVDATDLSRRIFQVRWRLPVAPGPLTLQYPKYIPGTHGPTGALDRLAGLQLKAGGQRIAWQRDLVDPYRFHLQIPAGAQMLEGEHQFLSPASGTNASLRMTDEIALLRWWDLLVYPAGAPASRLQVVPTVKLPSGWQHASALRVTARSGDRVSFEPTSVERLIDASVFAGRHVRRVPLEAQGSARPVSLTLFAHEDKPLESSEAQIQAHRNLVQQADRLFGSRHFRHYEFLLVLSDSIEIGGLEHHESSDNSLSPSYFQDWDKAAAGRDLLPHEYVHSWNGKFRRPADLWAPDLNEPTRNSLLWVYEGMTQYWGWVLAARSGLVTPEQSRNRLASTVAWLQVQPGRRWRDLQDTTNSPQIRGPRPEWGTWTRGWDYYDEGLLLWLDVDTRIREKSGGTRSLDDFARTFFGVADGRIEPLTYTLDDLVAALHAVAPDDWASFLRQRLQSHETAPLDGVARSGWRLAWRETPTSDLKAAADHDKFDDFQHSLGMRVAREGARIVMVRWDSPAFQAGLRPGLKVVGIGERTYSAERMDAALKGNAQGQAPIVLLVQDGDALRRVTLDVRTGPRHPVLERVDAVPEGLDAGIFRPR